MILSRTTTQMRPALAAQWWTKRRQRLGEKILRIADRGGKELIGDCHDGASGRRQGKGMTDLTQLIR